MSVNQVKTSKITAWDRYFQVSARGSNLQVELLQAIAKPHKVNPFLLASFLMLLVSVLVQIGFKN